VPVSTHGFIYFLQRYNFISATELQNEYIYILKSQLVAQALFACANSIVIWMIFIGNG